MGSYCACCGDNYDTDDLSPCPVCDGTVCDSCIMEDDGTCVDCVSDSDEDLDEDE